MSVSAESVKELLNSENLGDRLRAVNQIRELEPKVGLELLQIAIGDGNSRVRYSAVSQMDTLGEQDLELSLRLLRDLLNDPEADVQAAAADCLGALKLHAAFEDLQQLYHTTPEWLVQFSIIATLGELGDPRGLELLKQALSSNNGLIQTAAISSLGELGDVEAVPLLVPYTTNPDWQVRYRVVQALGNLGGAEAKSILATLVNDEVEAIANEAKKALQLA
ncbi:HEAT repeat domain-containing protein [Anabaena cylindrica FACHB-243]|uniref:PBS lyase HEAT domain protein repeat-containing protein n=1 Tax=Anabaena cylindrica (strain ATCC 27899 / PCC 7122) TaxID=272123 RepID=K9ZFY2_ANACC|nr:MULTISPECIES: HEAT repeat domain-containing protein [Anabaena]AFZ58133.1 PBS lyase HEAT domain protein repeat-containing protein [Anabaena cylindrica PCC 7122]MBD2419092.1 HEAT repeat domain-containing protein [Anabaena cylindrica FACHB-243]MBY5281239.1 HEAT repeat domain-containing protein [Anabaena sp. CCAP 1446/1C]MBY5310308.1 HEAT repeat domain-containing protein [Anabaena sp. CCAP 1446/1C]MCM2409562.1 HEAT repeat domain-containing protein [Anabaena sp. CCAP 1446/1C]